MTEARKIYRACCKALGLDDDTRRAMNVKITGKASSADFTADDWRRMIAHVTRATNAPARQPNEWAWVDSASEDRQPMLRKLIMLAKAAGIARGKQIAYIEGIAKQAAGIKGGSVAKPLRLCDSAELRVLVQALSVYNARRRKASQEATQ